MAKASPRFHWLRLRATAHPTEDEAKVRLAMRHTSGLEEEAFSAATTASRLAAHHGGEVVVLETLLEKARDIRAVLAAALPAAARERLWSEVESRTDDEGAFYFRIDKQEALAGSLRLADTEDTIQCRLRLEVHPAKRENVVAALRRLLQDGP